MELDATDVERLMAQSHHLTFITHGSNLQAVREILLRHHPRVVAAYGDIPLYPTEDGIVGDDMAGCSHTMEDIREILQFAAEHLANGLMPQTDA